MLTIDASVWLNANEPAEKGHADSAAFIARLIAVRPIVMLPTLAVVEIAASVARKRQDVTLAEAYAASVRGLTFVEWVPLDKDLSAAATKIAADRRLRGADGVYAAVAVEYGCDLVSLDNERLTRLTGVVRTLTPAAALAQLTP